jgi:hypothetical protein
VNTVLELGSEVELMFVPVVSVDVYLGKANILEETVYTVLELGSEVELPPMVQCGSEYRASHTRLASLNTE